MSFAPQAYNYVQAWQLISVIYETELQNSKKILGQPGGRDVAGNGGLSRMRY